MNREYNSLADNAEPNPPNGFEFGAQIEADRHSPEPVLYNRGNTRVQCSKPLLLQLFGSVSLLNLSECERIREAIIDLGGIHYIFKASKKVSDQADLWFIVYYVLLLF
jgi:hypothetical protein